MALYEHAARTVRYGRPEREKGEWASRRLDTLTDELRGDCKDKSALLVALLNAIDVPARFALIVLAHYGRRPMLPGPRFNHALVVARLDGQEVWLDPMDGLYTFGELPTADQGVFALVLEPDEPSYRLIPAARPEQHRIERVCRGWLNAEGNYFAAIRITASGEQAARWRAPGHGRDSATAWRLLQQTVAADLPGVDLSDVTSEHLNDLRGDVTLSFSAEIPGVGRRIRRLMLVSIPWLHRLRDRGFFGPPDRAQPLVNPLYRVTDRHEITLPSGWCSYGLPEPMSLTCVGWEYRCSIQEVDGRLICEREYVAHGVHIPPEAYAELRQFWAACLRLEEADVVLTNGGLESEAVP